MDKADLASRCILPDNTKPNKQDVEKLMEKDEMIKKLENVRIRPIFHYFRS